MFNRARRLQAKTVFSLNGIQRLIEVGLIVFVGLSAFMLLALLSFDPADPSWSQTGYNTDIHNFAGPVGARTADVLFTVFGWLSYLFPPFFGFCGYLLFKRFKDLISIDYLILGLRLLGLLVTVISACAISSINFDDFFIYSSGGVVGDVIVGILLPNLNFVGSSLLLLCGFCVGLTLLTGISWLTVADELGRFVVESYHFIRQLLARFQQGKQPEKTNSFTEIPAAKAVARSKDKIPAYNAAEQSAETEQTSAKVQVIAPVQERKEPGFSCEMRDMVEPTFDMAALNPETQVTDRTTSEDEVSVTEFTEAAPLIDDSTAIKVDPLLQSRAFFPDANAQVEPLPFQPLDANTDARAFVSVDELADDELTYSAIDDRYDMAELQQSFAHTQSAYAPVVAQEPPLDLDDDEQELGSSSVAAPQTLAELLPALGLLDRPNKTVNPISQEDLDKVSRLVELKLLDFNVDAKVVGVYPGPVVTRFELDLAPGVKVSKITGLSKDLARSLSAISVRVVEVIPGKSFIGLELPNQHREIVRLSEVIGDEIFEQSKSPLTMVLGKDIAGKSVVADLAKMPHLLVAGTTGSGKSVGVNVMICSLLYKSTPDDVRFLMIDPKMLELSVYEGIPHLLTEVVTDMKEAANGLRWCVGEMERRYKLMSALGVRNLKGYNVKVADAIAEGKPLRDPIWRAADDMRTEPPLLEKLPSIVVVIDEFADMMMIVGKKVEELIARIAQKARAAGIHLILATQRPSVDVITGLIKANIPTRIAFQVSSKIDSRTILDQQGAESLLGQGDMLYLPPGSGVPNRVHGAFVDDHEVHAVVADWKKRGRPNYIPEILNGETTEENLLPGETLEDEDAEADPLFDQAVAFVTESRKASVSGVQRRFRIGYNRAARLVETMEQIGIVSGPGHNGNREVLAPPPPKGF
ncbi:MAG: DNA translocase FtsK 4TM domain-containing protein [Gammaproteobacteria bacterium]|nr:DNA translocase FtsK 4TM domain-containing protein [Gammaproteobacteria bacterium]